MTTYSDAAEKYATTHVTSDSYKNWLVVAGAYDAGAASDTPAQPLVGRFPFTDGDCTVIGPECISTTPDSTPDCRLAWRGVWFSPLVPAAAVPAEPERLTDPDDPRIRVGAYVAITHATTSENSTTYRYRITAKTDGAPSVNHIRACVRTGAEVLLLAPAPDPDADTRQALVEIMTGIGVHDLTTDEATQVIMGLRERGVSL